MGRGRAITVHNSRGHGSQETYLNALWWMPSGVANSVAHWGTELEDEEENQGEEANITALGEDYYYLLFSLSFSLWLRISANAPLPPRAPVTACLSFLTYSIKGLSLIPQSSLIPGPSSSDAFPLSASTAFVFVSFLPLIDFKYWLIILGWLPKEDMNCEILCKKVKLA